MDEFRNITNLQWSRRVAWLCAGLASTTGLFALTGNLPQLGAESVEPQQVHVETSGDDALQIEERTFLSSDDDERHIRDAHHKTQDIWADQEVDPIGLWDKPVRTSGKSPTSLFRWRRSEPQPRDPFVEETIDKLAADVESNRQKRSPKTGRKPVGSGGNGRLKKGSDSPVDETPDDPAEESAQVAPNSQVHERSTRDSASKNRLSGPLATRRRLLEQLEKGDVENKPSRSDSSPVEPESVPPAEDPIEPGQEEPTPTEVNKTVPRSGSRLRSNSTSQRLKSAAKQSESDESGVRRVTTTPSFESVETGSSTVSDVGQPSDATLKSMFEDSDTTSEPREPNSKSSRFAMGGTANSTGATPSNSLPNGEARRNSQDADLERKADADPDPAQNETEATVTDAPHRTGELSFQALKLRAELAHRQGRFNAARQLEQTAVLIERERNTQPGHQSKVEPVSDSLTGNMTIPRDHHSNELGVLIQESVQPKVTSPEPRKGELDSASPPPAEMSRKNQATRKTRSVPGRAKLHPDPEPILSPAFSARRKTDPTALVNTVPPSSLTLKIPKSELDEGESKIQLSPLSPVPSASVPGQLARTSEVTGFEPVINPKKITATDLDSNRPEIPNEGTGSALVDSAVPIRNAKQPLALATRPSLTPIRVVTPNLQVSANRSVEIPPPMGWSAFKRTPNQVVVTKTTSPTKLPGTLEREATHAAAPEFQTEPPTVRASQSKIRQATINTIEVDPVEVPPAPIQVLAGDAETPALVQDAYYHQESQQAEPALIENHQLDAKLKLENQRDASRPSWLLAAILSLVATALAVVMTRALGKREQ